MLARAWHDHAACCVLYARGLTDAPDDAVQEAFVRLMRRLQTEPMPDSPRAWLITATRSAALDARKRETRHRLRIAKWAGEVALTATTPTKFESRSVGAALDQLERDLREPVVLRLWVELSFEQIAGLIKTSASTAHDRYQRGLAALRDILGDDHDG